MKYLVLLLIVAAVLWLMRSGRGAGTKDAPGAAPSRQATSGRGVEPRVQQVVACSHCGVHLPLSEALPGSGGRLYCSESHRQLKEGGA